MGIIIKTEEQIAILREGGKRLSDALLFVASHVKAGVSSLELDQYARDYIEKLGDTPAFLGYRPEGVSYPYPSALCVSINNEVVHGLPKKNRVLKEGDIVSIDLGLNHKGLYTDMAMTVPVGKTSKKNQELLHRTEESLFRGIEQARAGNRIGDIGHAIESYIKPFGYGIIRELAGHGVGVKIHEDPFVPNYGKKGTGEILRPGMVIAIEPMINEGGRYVVFDEDEYTVRTEDGSRSAHFEKTILITEGDPEILTP